MRISDWSSDVCSSDLVVLERVALALDALDHRIGKADLGATGALRCGQGGECVAEQALGEAAFRRHEGDSDGAGGAQADTVGPIGLRQHEDEPLGERRGVLAAADAGLDDRSEERRVGQACVRTWRYRWSPYH